ncbi:MAG: polyprenyl synthetase family protein [Gracilimonas sp.]|nr:polyprenyl synthetase family protein [Gracilimonas sp.]
MSNSKIQKHLLQKIEAGISRLQLPNTPQTLYEPYRYAIEMGGKRIRPLLSLLACGICGGDPDEALHAALSVEILHNFTLVHDDIMDSADTRRGEPSVFKKWNENIAILSGDVMFADAYKILLDYGNNDSFSKQEYVDLHSVFSEAVITVCEGQALDMEFVDRTQVNHEEYIQMIAGKTAALLSASLEMGAITAHASVEQRKELAELGYEMGIAFQIQDDLLDATADPDKFGKKPGGDIYEGKKTYLTILALERANEQQKKHIQNTLQAQLPSDEQVQEVLSIMNELNVLTDVASETDQHYEKAFELVNSFDSSDYQQELKNLLIFLRNRDH